MKISHLLGPALAAVLFLVLASVEAKAPVRGEKAPEFTLTSLDGKKVRLSDYRGKVVLLDFWATWCAPCVEAIPHLNRLQQQYGSKGLSVVGVSVDKGPAARVKDFSRKRSIRYTVLHDPESRVGSTYDASSIPLLYIIGRDGTVRAIHMGYSADGSKRIDAQVRELLGR